MVIYIIFCKKYTINKYIINVEWDNLSCETIKTNNENGNPRFECKCKELSVSTIVNDIEYLFTTSKVGDVFSDKGLEY